MAWVELKGIWNGTTSVPFQMEASKDKEGSFSWNRADLTQLVNQLWKIKFLRLFIASDSIPYSAYQG